MDFLIQYYSSSFIISIIFVREEGGPTNVRDWSIFVYDIKFHLRS